MWDHYFGETAGYAPGTEEIVLIRIDRDMQLAEAMAEDPPLLRWLAHAHVLEEVVHDGIKSLEMLSEEQVLSEEAARALATLHLERDDVIVAIIPGADRFSRTWWNLKLASSDFTFPQGARTEALRSRALAVGSIIWGLGAIGLIFIPSAIRCLRGAFREKPRGYAAAWQPSLGITIFLLATLAWIGFSMVVELGIMQFSGIHPVLAILLDTAARILPTLIALALLFRKASHIPRAIGLDGHIHPPLLLGLFSLLVLTDQPLRWALGRFTPADPTGGLSYADAGISGLIFLIVSACLFAPIAEEILYRGILHRSLANRIGVLGGAIISSAIFASLHFYDWYGLASVAIFGFVCALTYQSTRSLIDVVALHMLYNTSITLPEWTIYHAPF
ncbi:CPBP family intramembrane metalloprotease [Akkermansiaceae bacterium]|nr:CPBP family intramembrane metalloprotease [Akkermansiaceae bacterium]